MSKLWGGGEGMSHSREGDCHGLSSAFLPSLVERTRLRMVMRTPKASIKAPMV
ncbi:MAG: hypothetical protein P3W89_003345 [Aquificaceae bacterium]|nr:hypothetical protein [Aquificaceae bacterium]